MPFFRTVEGPSHPVTQIEGRQLVNLGSNNYLGLATDPRVTKAAASAIATWGVGVTGSRLMNGNLSLHRELEEEIGAFLGREAAVVLPTGYVSNLALLSALTRRGDAVAADEEIHASCHDGVRLSGASLRTFAHNDVTDMVRAVGEDHRAGICLVEGVYSMSGDIAPLAEIGALVGSSPTMVVVDEAHALGVIGSAGRGAAEHAHAEDVVDAVVLTFSKSLAGCGGAIAGGRELIDALRYTARPFMFTASSTPASLAGALAALRVLRAHPEYAGDVRERAECFSSELNAMGTSHRHSGTAIITARLGSDARTAQAWKMLWNRGIFCNAAISPAVPAGRGGLRFSFMRTHALSDIRRAARTCGEVLNELDRTTAAVG
ncbi:MAG: pyridoxal phosphate-dependent aminotransferase family protein [Tepidisphaeraceae bacterium]